MTQAQQGIIYNTLGQRERGVVSNYHAKPDPVKLNKTPYVVDVSGLKSVQQRESLKFDGVNFESKFTIGFEVEKNQLYRGAVKEYELFCGFERDGSCGYEAVTHILPLLPPGKWRTKVFDMMHKAEKIIDDRYSPSDKRCGGHITIGIDGMSGEDIRKAIRKNSGIILALFRKRLNNTYCGSNRRMQAPTDTNINSYSQSGSYSSYSAHHKYQLGLAKNNCFEFRLPSKFESVKQMMRRYELFYEIVNFSVNKPNGKLDSLLKIVKPIILSMYNGDVDKTEHVLKLSKDFTNFILNGDISEDITDYLS